MTEFSLTLEAEEDVWRIWQYFVNEAGYDVAGRVETQLLEAFKALAANPNVGHRRPDLTRRDMLFYRVFSFLLIYEANRRPVQILRVVHGNRNLARLLKHAGLDR